MINYFLRATLLGLVLSQAPASLAAPAERPCRDDVMKHCGDAIGDRQQMRQCMQKNFSQFSEQCRNAIAARRQGQGQGQGQGSGQNGKPGGKPQNDN